MLGNIHRLSLRTRICQYRLHTGLIKVYCLIFRAFHYRCITTKLFWVQSHCNSLKDAVQPTKSSCHIDSLSRESNWLETPVLVASIKSGFVWETLQFGVWFEDLNFLEMTFKHSSSNSKLAYVAAGIDVLNILIDYYKRSITISQPTVSFKEIFHDVK